MKRIKNVLIMVWNIYGILSLVMHEISHIIVMCLLFVGIRKIEFSREKNLSFGCLIMSRSRVSRWKVFLISFSPVMLFLVILVLSFFSVTFLVIMIYCLTNMQSGRTLPSETDIDAFQFYDVNEGIIEVSGE